MSSLAVATGLTILSADIAKTSQLATDAGEDRLEAPLKQAQDIIDSCRIVVEAERDTAGSPEDDPVSMSSVAVSERMNHVEAAMDRLITKAAKDLLDHGDLIKTFTQLAKKLDGLGAGVTRDVAISLMLFNIRDRAAELGVPNE